MHIRLLALSALLFSGLNAGAQQTRSVGTPAFTRIISTDTLIVAPNIDSGALRRVTDPELSVKQIKPVPLAGNREYFGSHIDFVNEFCRNYLKSRQRTLSIVQQRSLKHFALMHNVLKKHGLPREVIYLAVIESALNNKALSPAGAMGPWQLMTGTAQLMGLTVNGKRDDRTDWYKSTNAAAKYLKYLYKELDDWLLVIAAYNSGPVPVKRAIARTGSNNFWDIKKYLPRETQGHVLAFIATASIFENMSKYIATGVLPEDFRFGKDAAPAVVKPKPAFSQEELKQMAIVHIKEPLDMDVLVQQLGLSRNQLERWNPDYDMFLMGATDDETYGLRIPKEKLNDFIAGKESLNRLSRNVFSQMSY